MVVFGNEGMKILRNSLQTENIVQKITQLKWQKNQKRSYQYVMNPAKMMWQFKYIKSNAEKSLPQIVQINYKIINNKDEKSNA